MRPLLLAVALLLPTQSKSDPEPPLLFEAEDFRTPGHGWEARKYGTNYYVGTFANTFLSRKAYLGAPEQCDYSAATLDVQIPKAGRYLALVRYEAAYRFETRFKLQIEQNGRFKLDRTCGARESLKVWAFGQKLKREVAWEWGATENIVWEGHADPVALEAGPARLTLVADRQSAAAARRNVDCILLTRSDEDVRRRIESENYLPLDGLLTQAGDLFARIRNKAATPLTLTIPPGTEHSPYWVHRRTWQPLKLQVAPAATTDWIEVGHLLDTLNDGQWAIGATEGGVFNLEFGLRNAAGLFETIRHFENLTGPVTLAYDADTRVSRRIRPVEDVLYDLVDDLKRESVHGRPPRQTLVYGTTFDPRPQDARYSAARREFIDLIGATGFEREDLGPKGLIRGSIDVRGMDARQLRELADRLVADQRADRIAVVSLGDEIGLARPPAEDHAGFRAWLREARVEPNEVEPEARGEWSRVKYDRKDRTHPRRFYYSNLYAYRFGIRALKEHTDILRAALPNAGIGANFSPHHGTPYLGETHQWVSLFREGGMTMPWSEDYIFQMPVASPQMNFLSLDLFRAGLEDKPEARIHFYVMPHWPGNAPAAWRRQFYGAIAHGAKILNLFEFRPVQAAYTENHVDHPSMYREVRRSLHELGLFEDLVLEGRPDRAPAALWFSETADVWEDAAGSFGAAKRSLYVAARHLQLPLDVAVSGRDLRGRSLLFLADRHVARRDAREIADWVETGGILFATAGAGMLDEFEEPNTVLRTLFGIEELKLEVDPAPIRLEKQDLPFAKPLDHAEWKGVRIPAFGAVSRLAADGAQVEARFGDFSPAFTTRKAGRGRAAYGAFLPAFSYFRPALPARPPDRGHAEDTLAQLLPTEFHRGAAELIGSVADVERSILATEPLVETTLLRSRHGALLPLINWSGKPLSNLMVILRADVPADEVTLATGRPVRAIREKEGLVFTFDLDVADALILRRK